MNLKEQIRLETALIKRLRERFLPLDPWPWTHARRIETNRTVLQDACVRRLRLLRELKND